MSFQFSRKLAEIHFCCLLGPHMSLHLFFASWNKPNVETGQHLPGDYPSQAEQPVPVLRLPAHLFHKSETLRTVRILILPAVEQLIISLTCQRQQSVWCWPAENITESIHFRVCLWFLFNLKHVLFSPSDIPPRATEARSQWSELRDRKQSMGMKWLIPWSPKREQMAKQSSQHLVCSGPLMKGSACSSIKRHGGKYWKAEGGGWTIKIKDLSGTHTELAKEMCYTPVWLRVCHFLSKE